MDFLLFPLFELMHPLILAFGLPEWTLSLATYFGGATLTAVPLLLWRGIHRASPNLTEALCFVAPGFVWAFVVLLSDYQLMLCAASFYFGILGGAVFLPEYIKLLDLPQENRLLLAALTIGFALIPLLLTLTAGPAEWGPAITLQHGISDPGAIVF